MKLFILQYIIIYWLLLLIVYITVIWLDNLVYETILLNTYRILFSSWILPIQKSHLHTPGLTLIAPEIASMKKKVWNLKKVINTSILRRTILNYKNVTVNFLKKKLKNKNQIFVVILAFTSFVHNIYFICTYFFTTNDYIPIIYAICFNLWNWPIIITRNEITIIFFSIYQIIICLWFDK